MNELKNISAYVAVLAFFMISCQKSQPRLGIIPQKYTRGIYSDLKDKELELKIDRLNHLLDSLDNKKTETKREIEDAENMIMSYSKLLKETGLPPFIEENLIKRAEIESNKILIEKSNEWLNNHEKDYLNNETIALRDKIRLIENYQEKLDDTKDFNILLQKIYIDFRDDIKKGIEKEEELKRELESAKSKYEKKLNELIEKREDVITKKKEKIISLETEIESIKNQLVNVDSIEKKYKEIILEQQLIKSDYDSIYKFVQSGYDTVSSVLLSYDIEYYIRKSKSSGLQIKEFREKIDDLIQLQNKFVEILSQTDEKTTQFRWDQIRKQMTDLENLFDKYENLKDRVTSLFRGGMFSKYFGLSEEEIIADDPEVRAPIETYKIMVPFIIDFLEAYPKYNIYIDGHADRTPWSGDLYGNVKLSKNRAEIAKQRFVDSGISSIRIITDWFGEFHNTKKIPLDCTDPQQVADRRVDLRIIGGKSDSTEQKKKYLNFKNDFPVVAGPGKKIFRHREGFWIEHGFEDADYSIMQVIYEDSAYTNLLKESEIARQVLARYPSPLYPKGEIELGNQVKFILPINGVKHKVIIAAMPPIVEEEINQK
ncbi:OmpA family protein [candidate division KSB1 bacterium]|nr:OmpA family protein [candidate division KSB1 bacterium]